MSLILEQRRATVSRNRISSEDRVRKKVHVTKGRWRSIIPFARQVLWEREEEKQRTRALFSSLSILGQEVSCHLMGTRGAKGFLPCPLFGILGRSRLEGHLVCEHGAVRCGWAEKGLGLALQLSICCVWPRWDPEVPTSPGAAKGSWSVGLQEGSPMLRSDMVPRQRPSGQAEWRMC